jgi:SHAQKYF class myb-like DNA-binding protein
MRSDKNSQGISEAITQALTMSRIESLPTQIIKQTPSLSESKLNETLTDEEDFCMDDDIMSIISLRNGISEKQLLYREECQEQVTELSNDNSPLNLILFGNEQKAGRWTTEEHKKFMEGMLYFANDWKKVQNHIKTRTSTQARSHAQKFFLKLSKNFVLESGVKNISNINMEKLEEWIHSESIRILGRKCNKEKEEKLRKVIMNLMFSRGNVRRRSRRKMADLVESVMDTPKQYSKFCNDFQNEDNLLTQSMQKKTTKLYANQKEIIFEIKKKLTKKKKHLLAIKKCHQRIINDNFQKICDMIDLNKDLSIDPFWLGLLPKETQIDHFEKKETNIFDLGNGFNSFHSEEILINTESTSISPVVSYKADIKEFDSIAFDNSYEKFFSQE